MLNTGEQVFSSFSASSEAAALGVAGMLPLLVYGLALDLRRDDWDWVRKIDQATSEVALQLFGSERQVGCVCVCVCCDPGRLRARYFTEPKAVTCGVCSIDSRTEVCMMSILSCSV